MPSLLHDGIVRLFRDRPDLAPTLLRDVLGVTLPPYHEARIESGDLTDVVPAARHADVVIVLTRDGSPVHADIVEVQLAVDPDKLLSWPAYVANLRGRLGCDVELLVVAPDRAVASWAARPIRMGPSNLFHALVIGPERLPSIEGRARARSHPELSVLTAMAHGQSASRHALRSALTAMDAAMALEGPRALLYSDLVWLALNDAARRALEAMMRPGGYEYQSEFVRRYFEEGRTEGRAEGRAELLSKQLQLKFGALPDDVRERIAAASIDELDRWAERVLTAATLDELFG